ncbi:hypothetical protein SSX86_030433 [Deinandra increscens subsp. villosa]|uniref:Uncharacterized protein n=1 Tax=Deinandra increscens subsp. villosa TaxID=3103831 RepID=A0AAP0CAR7_9ASTR
MGRRQLLYLLYTSAARPPSPTPYFPPTPPPPPFLFRKPWNKHRHRHRKPCRRRQNRHERAPSTMEVFKRLEEEKASEEVASQTAEKAKVGVMEAVAGDGSVESVKESFKKDAGDGNVGNTGEFLRSK